MKQYQRRDQLLCTFCGHRAVENEQFINDEYARTDLACTHCSSKYTVESRGLVDPLIELTVEATSPYSASMGFMAIGLLDHNEGPNYTRSIVPASEAAITGTIEYFQIYPLYGEIQWLAFITESSVKFVVGGLTDEQRHFVRMSEQDELQGLPPAEPLLTMVNRLKKSMVIVAPAPMDAAA